MANLSTRIEDIAADTEKLTELPGIGDRMAEHIQEILRTGDYSTRAKLLKKYPRNNSASAATSLSGPKESRHSLENFQSRNC